MAQPPSPTHNSNQITVKESGPNVEAGTYEAQLAKMESETGNFGPQRKLTFMVSAGEYEGEGITSWINDKGDGFSPISNGYKVVSALLGRDLNEYLLDGNTLDWDDLVGKKLRLVVTEAKREDGTEFSKITDYLARQKKGTLKDKVKEIAQATSGATQVPTSGANSPIHDPLGEPPEEDD